MLVVLSVCHLRGFVLALPKTIGNDPENELKDKKKHFETQI